MNEPLNLFIEQKENFLSFLKTRFNIFHDSNLFFRDLHYGVMMFLKMNKLPSGYSSSEELTKQVIASYEDSKIFLPIDERTWTLNYLPFRKVAAKPIPAAKPATKPLQSPSPTIPKAMPQNPAAKPVEVQGAVAG